MPPTPGNVPPVSQSPLYQNGKSLLPGSVSARFGLASALADAERSPDQAKILHNFQQWRKRFIWTTHGIGYLNDNAAALNSGARVLEFGKFYSTAGVLTILVQAGNKLYPYDPVTHTAGTAITTPYAIDSAAVPCMRAYAPSTQTTQPITVWCNGVQNPIKITSTAASAALLAVDAGGSAAWPCTLNGKVYNTPKFCENFGDRMVYAGFPDASTALDVLISNQGSAELFTQAVPILATDCIAFSVNGNLGGITGLKAFRPSNTELGQIFLVGQRDGISLITGTNTTNYRTDDLTNMYGIINNRCWAQVLDDLVFLTDKGVYSFSSLIQNQTRPQDALSYVVSDRIQSIDFDNAANMFCVHHPITQEIQFWFPYVGDSGQNKRGLVLCYNSDGGLSAPVWSSKDLGGNAISCGADFRNSMYCGDYAGFIQKHYNGDTYNGSVILFDYVSALITVGNLIQGGRIRNVSVVTDGQAQKFSISLFSYSRYMDGSTRKQPCNPFRYQLGDSSPGVTVLPFVLGSASFPSDFVKTHNFSSIGRGLAFEIELSNTSTAADGLDYSRCDFTISIGGLTRR